MLMDEYVAFSRGVQVTKMSSLSERRVPGGLGDNTFKIRPKGGENTQEAHFLAY